MNSRSVGSRNEVSWPQAGQYAPSAAAPQLRAQQSLVDPRQDAAKDVDFLLFQPGAREQTAQPRQQPLRMGGAQKLEGDQGTLAMLE